MKSRLRLFALRGEKLRFGQDNVQIVCDASYQINEALCVNATTGATIASPSGSNDVKTISLTGLTDGDYALRIEGENTGLRNKYDIAFGTIVPRQKDVDPNRIALRLDAKPIVDIPVIVTSGVNSQSTFLPSPTRLVFTPGKITMGIDAARTLPR